MAMDDAADTYSAWKGWESDFAVEGRGDRPYFRREVRELLSPGTHDVLEVGFGNGSFLAFGTATGWKMSGTEMLPELIDAARSHGYDVRSAAELDDVPDESFDAVVALDVFEHIDPAHSVSFLEGLARTLKPNGRIILRFPNADSWLGNAFQNGDPTHVNAIGAVKMTFYARAAHLEIVDFRPATRRGFATSVIHGLHKVTAGTYISISAAVRRALHFPGLRIVLSTSDVVCVLKKGA